MTTFQDINPATEEIIADIPVSSSEKIKTAVDAAQRAQQSWSQTPFKQRAQMLIKGGESLSCRIEELAHRVTLEMGKPYGEALGEARGWAGSIPGKMKEVAQALEPIKLKGESSETTIVREPPWRGGSHHTLEFPRGHAH